MFPVYVLSFLFCAVNALRNVTVDDNDPQIIYTPPQSWATSATTPLDAGGSHKLTQDPTATAKFVFTGVAIYFLSPRWPYTVNTQISLDSGPSVLVDLVDHTRPGTLDGPETVQSQVVWNVAGLTNTQHTLMISVGEGQPFAIVDALIYTVPDASDVSSTSEVGSSTKTTHSSPSTSVSSSATHTGDSADNTASSQSQPYHVLPIILGTVLGLAALSIFIIGLVFFCRRRRHRPASEVWTVAGTSNPTLPRMPASPFAPFPGGEIYTGRYPNIDRWHSHPYANAKLIPGAMSPATAAALAHPHAETSGEGIPWQGTTAQMTEKFNNRVPERYQPSILSTINETSPQPTVTPLAYSPASQQTELRDTSMQSGHSTSPPIHQIPSQNYSTLVDGRWNGPKDHPYSRRPPTYV